MATTFNTLTSDYEFAFASGVTGSGAVETIHVYPTVGNIVYDIINEDGASVSLLASNHQKELIDAGGEILDGEMGVGSGSPFTTTTFNQTFIAPNFLRFKTDGVGAVKIRLRGNR